MSVLRLPVVRAVALLGLGALVLAGCQRNPLVVKRSPCAAVAVPIYANDMTLLYPGTAPDAANVDLVASMTNVRGTCNEGVEQLVSDVSYQVVARRSDASAARQVQLPVFASVVQGGNLLVSKQVASVTIDFPAGQARGVGVGSARATIDRDAASLSAGVQKIINRKRKPGDPDAAVDPMADPEVRAALRAASFELLVGFQLSEQQLAFNVTK
ncbi:hypothetical protein [Polymorphobacter sp.]|uniref:hypothetical protein n=1 Tax=Polymorphobacter sp. TaxID=1909290 RepID=UPI003F7291E6